MRRNSPDSFSDTEDLIRELRKERDELALQLAAMREALEKIKLSCKFAIEKIANSNPEKEYLIPEKVLDLILPILSTPISALVAQMEKKLEAAEKILASHHDGGIIKP